MSVVGTGGVGGGDGAATVEPTSAGDGTTTLTITGTEQSRIRNPDEKGKGGRLRIRAESRTHKGKVWWGPFFSVCAHACNFDTKLLDNDPKKSTVFEQDSSVLGREGLSGKCFGLTVIHHYKSDSPDPADLSIEGRLLGQSGSDANLPLRDRKKIKKMDEGQMSFGIGEIVKCIGANGPGGRPGGPFKALKSATQGMYVDAMSRMRPYNWVWDFHWYPWGEFRIEKGRGTVVFHQKFIGLCRRCGGRDIDLDNSGFEIEHSAFVASGVNYRAPAGTFGRVAQDFVIQTRERGARVLGATAGSGSVRSVLIPMRE